jgi:hypothetical protein
MRDTMTPPWRPNFIPEKRRGAENLIDSVDGDLTLLTTEQIAAIRALYFLDPPESEMSVADLVRLGRLQP